MVSETFKVKGVCIGGLLVKSVGYESSYLISILIFDRSYQQFCTSLFVKMG